MKSRNLIMLLIAAALLAGLAYYRSELDRRRAAALPAPGTTVFPDLEINRIAKLSLRDGQTAATIRRQPSGRWEVVEKHGYAADFNRLRDLLTGIADLKIGRPLRIDRDLRSELELSGPDIVEDGQPSAGLLIEMADANDNILASLILGRTFHRDRDPQEHPMHFHWRGADGRYIMTHRQEAFLVSEAFSDASADPDHWIDRDFIDLPSHALIAFEWSRGESDPIRLERKQPGDPWEWPAKPESRSLAADRIREIASTLGSLRFDDIAAPDSAAAHQDDDQALRLLAAQTDDGRRYQLTIGDASEDGDRSKHWLRVAAGYELPPDPEENDRDADEDARIADRVHRHTREIGRINERLGTWTYLIGNSTAEKLLIDSADLLKAEEPTE